MNDNDDEPRGDGGGGDGATELSLSHVVQAFLELDTSLKRKGEKITPTKVSPRHSSCSSHNVIHE